MSPQALEIAVNALEAEVDQARDWERAADVHLMRAGATLALAARRREEAGTHRAAAQEALDFLRGLQQPVEAQQDPDEDWTTDDVPEGAEAFGGGVTVLQRGADEPHEQWTARLGAAVGDEL